MTGLDIKFLEYDYHFKEKTLDSSRKQKSDQLGILNYTRYGKKSKQNFFRYKNKDNLLNDSYERKKQNIDLSLNAKLIKNIRDFETNFNRRHERIKSQEVTKSIQSNEIKTHTNFIEIPKLNFYNFNNDFAPNTDESEFLIIRKYMMYNYSIMRSRTNKKFHSTDFTQNKRFVIFDEEDLYKQYQEKINKASFMIYDQIPSRKLQRYFYFKETELNEDFSKILDSIFRKVLILKDNNKEITTKLIKNFLLCEINNIGRKPDTESKFNNRNDHSNLLSDIKFNKTRSAENDFVPMLLQKKLKFSNKIIIPQNSIKNENDNSQKSRNQTVYELLERTDPSIKTIKSTQDVNSTTLQHFFNTKTDFMNNYENNRINSNHESFKFLKDNKIKSKKNLFDSVNELVNLSTSKRNELATKSHTHYSSNLSNSKLKTEQQFTSTDYSEAKNTKEKINIDPGFSIQEKNISEEKKLNQDKKSRYIKIDYKEKLFSNSNKIRKNITNSKENNKQIIVKDEPKNIKEIMTDNLIENQKESQRIDQKQSLQSFIEIKNIQEDLKSKEIKVRKISHKKSLERKLIKLGTNELSDNSNNNKNSILRKLDGKVSSSKKLNELNLEKETSDSKKFKRKRSNNKEEPKVDINNLKINSIKNSEEENLNKEGSVINQLRKKYEYHPESTNSNHLSSPQITRNLTNPSFNTKISQVIMLSPMPTIMISQAVSPTKELKKVQIEIKSPVKSKKKSESRQNRILTKLSSPVKTDEFKQSSSFNLNVNNNYFLEKSNDGDDPKSEQMNSFLKYERKMKKSKQLTAIIMADKLKPFPNNLQAPKRNSKIFSEFSHKFKSTKVLPSPLLEIHQSEKDQLINKSETVNQYEILQKEAKHRNSFIGITIKKNLDWNSIFSRDDLLENILKSWKSDKLTENDDFMEIIPDENDDYDEKYINNKHNEERINLFLKEAFENRERNSKIKKLIRSKEANSTFHFKRKENS